jgi:hypothetical protein
MHYLQEPLTSCVWRSCRHAAALYSCSRAKWSKGVPQLGGQSAGRRGPTAAGFVWSRAMWGLWWTKQQRSKYSRIIPPSPLRADSHCKSCSSSVHSVPLLVAGIPAHRNPRIKTENCIINRSSWRSQTLYSRCIHRTQTVRILVDVHEGVNVTGPHPWRREMIRTNLCRFDAGLRCA